MSENTEPTEEQLQEIEEMENEGVPDGLYD